MRTEIHVHGYLELVEGVSNHQVETALRPLLDHLDLEQLSEIQSLEPDQPGFHFNALNWTLDICCTLDVRHDFLAALETAMHQLGRLVENAAPIEISTYHEDGRDEFQLLFVGPTPAAILDAQRREMLADIEDLLARQFNPQAVNEVLALVDKLFRKPGSMLSAPEATQGDNDLPTTMPSPPGRRRLH